jgi:hypothetical protein
MPSDEHDENNGHINIELLEQRGTRCQSSLQLPFELQDTRRFLGLPHHWQRKSLAA